jgi:uncharacterized protein (DUF58 family)
LNLEQTHNRRENAQALAANLPPLLAEARHLAATVVAGDHGRRQVGPGDEFWQFRPAIQGDSRRAIDWRRSGRGDTHFIRQSEWQAAQSVYFWIDRAQSMGFSGDRNRITKADRGVVLGLAAAILMVRAGERVALLEDMDPARSGRAQIDRLVAQLAMQGQDDDYGIPTDRALPNGSGAVFLTDLLGNWDRVKTAIHHMADRGVGGAIVQILDPIEEEFPFDGRTEFRSMSGALRFETLRAKGLRQAYLDELARRKAEARAVCDQVGWRYLCHHTSDGALSTLTWLYRAMEQAR